MADQKKKKEEYVKRPKVQLEDDELGWVWQSVSITLSHKVHQISARSMLTK